MLENNRFERLYQKAKHRKVVFVGIIIILLLVIEVSAIAAEAAWSIGIRKHSAREVAARYYLTKLLVIPFLRETGDGKEYLGNLTETEGEWRKMYPADALLGWRLGKNKTARHYNKYLYITNGQGFASLGEDEFRYARPKPAWTYRIIVLGGSTVMGDGVPVPADNLPACIRRAIEEHIPRSKRLEVINAGVGGYDSSNEFLYLISELINYEPDLVIVYDGWNDEAYSNRDLAKRPNAPNSLKLKVQYDYDERLNASYEFGGSFAIFAEGTLVSIRKALAHTGIGLPIMIALDRVLAQKKEVEPAAPYNPSSITRYRENLENILLIAEKHSAGVALFLQPIIGVDDKPYTPEELSTPISDMKTRKLFYADASAMFSNLKKRYFRPGSTCIEDMSKIFDHTRETVYADSGHIQRRGNEIVARKIVQKLQTCQLVE